MPSCCSHVSDGQHHISFSGLLRKHEPYHQDHDPVKSLGHTFTRVTSVTAPLRDQGHELTLEKFVL